MSLIDEALKRAQAAHQGETRPGGSGSRPWIPLPLPDRSQARRGRALAVGAAVVFLLIASFWFLVLRRSPGGTAQAARTSGRPAASPAQPTPLSEIIVAPPSRGISAPEAGGPAAARRARAAAGPAPAASSTSSASSAPAGAPPGHPPGALVNGHTYAGSISLPGGAKIELGGIVFSESNATALVNGRPLGAGAYVEGFTIVKIEENRVELEGNGLTVFLTLAR